MTSWIWRGSNDKMQEQIPMPTRITFDAIQQPTPTATAFGSSTTSLDLFSSTSWSRNYLSTTLEESSDEPISLRRSTRLKKLNPSTSMTFIQLVNFLLLFQILHFMEK